MIAASGDAGAFDINRSYTYPDCTTLLTVDFPAVRHLVLAAGGTTLPNTLHRLHGTVTVPAERAWGWDYLTQLHRHQLRPGTYYTQLLPRGRRRRRQRQLHPADYQAA